jgi:hypothetical protein
MNSGGLVHKLTDTIDSEGNIRASEGSILKGTNQTAKRGWITESIIGGSRKWGVVAIGVGAALHSVM